MQVLAARGSLSLSARSPTVVRQLFEPFLARLRGRSEPSCSRARRRSRRRCSTLPSSRPSLPQIRRWQRCTACTGWRRTSPPAGRFCSPSTTCTGVDLPSLRWLAYVLPRMEGLGLVVGLRPGEPGEDPGLLGQIVSDPLAAVIRPAPLSMDGAARLVRESLSPDAEDGFCAACHEETGGNPLLLRELMHAVAAEGLAPTEPASPEHARRTGGGSRAVTVRLSRLPPESRRLAQAVAILGDDADPRQAAALADLDEQAASEAAGALARVDVLRPQPPLGFVHPIIRAAVYEALTPLERDSGHARAAALLLDAGAEPERVAAHLLLIPAGADSGVVAVLRDAARRAVSRGASESAVAYLRRALAEPPSAAERADLLLELGSAEALVRGDAAVEHLREVTH